MQFGTVGVVGFLVDTAVVYATRSWAGLYVGGTLAYAAAVTTTWWLNRVWTFRGIGNIGPAHRQWLKFVVASLPGLCLNLGTYFLLVALLPLCAAHPEIAIAAGAVAGHVRQLRPLPRRGVPVIRTAVLIPCHNEAVAIGRVVAGFRAALPDAAVFVYDNNSTDGTIQAARRPSRRHRPVRTAAVARATSSAACSPTSRRTPTSWSTATTRTTRQPPPPCCASCSTARWTW